MDQGNFTNLSWDQDGQDAAFLIEDPRGDAEGGIAGNPTAHASVSIRAGGGNPNALDLAGGDATLECTVTSPIKENDGTKDAYMSYLVTTHVRPSSGS